MCMPSKSAARGQVTAPLTSNTPLLVSPWTRAAGATKLRVIRSIQAVSGLTSTTTQYRFAQVLQDKPGSWTGSGATLSGAGWTTDNFDISATTDQMWVQAGLFGLASSPPGQALGSLQLQTDADGVVLLAERTIDMVPTTGATYNEIALTDFVPLVGVAGLMVTVVYSHEGGTTYCYPLYRKVTNDRDAAPAWSNLISPAGFTADTNYNSGMVAVTDDTTKMFLQAGIKYKNTTYGGRLRVSVVGRW